MGLFEKVLYCPNCRTTVTGSQEKCEICHGKLYELSSSPRKWEKLSSAEKSQAILKAEQAANIEVQQTETEEYNSRQRELQRMETDRNILTLASDPARPAVSILGTVFAAVICETEDLDDEDCFTDEASAIEEAFFQAENKLLSRAQARGGNQVVGLQSSIVRSDDSEVLVITLTGTAVKTV